MFTVIEKSTRVLLFLVLQICCGSATRVLGHPINVDVSLYLQGSSDGEAFHIQYGTVKDDIPRPYYDSRNLNIFLIPALNETLDELIGPLLDTEQANVFSFYYEDPSNVQSMSDSDKLVVITKGAELMAKFILQLSKVLDMDLDNVQLIGYGGGAHVAGIIGSNLKSKIKSIVALDPSYPVYKIKYREHVLDPSDAKNVHVIHTSGRTIGVSVNLGTSDFYPNGGMSQPGCEGDKSGVCSHHRAIEYYIESLKKGNAFVCFKCTSYTYVKNLSLEKCHEYGLLGRLVPDDRINGVHYCLTQPSPPYMYSIVPNPDERQSHPIGDTVSNEPSPTISPPRLHSTAPNLSRIKSNPTDVTVSNEASPTTGPPLLHSIVPNLNRSQSNPTDATAPNKFSPTISPPDLNSIAPNPDRSQSNPTDMTVSNGVSPTTGPPQLHSIFPNLNRSQGNSTDAIVPNKAAPTISPRHLQSTAPNPNQSKSTPTDGKLSNKVSPTINPPHLNSKLPDSNRSQSKPTDVPVSNEASSTTGPPNVHSIVPNLNRSQSNPTDATVPNKVSPTISPPHLNSKLPDSDRSQSKPTDVTVSNEASSTTGPPNVHSIVPNLNRSQSNPTDATVLNKVSPTISPPHLNSKVPDSDRSHSKPIDVTVSNEASPTISPPHLPSISPNPDEGRSDSIDVSVTNGALPQTPPKFRPSHLYSTAETKVPTKAPPTPSEASKHKVEPEDTNRMMNVYVVKDLASQLENELQEVADRTSLTNAEYDKREITTLVDSVQKYIFKGMGRLFGHIPGLNLEQVISDLEALNQDVGHLLDIGRKGLQQGQKPLQQFSDKLDKLLNTTHGVLGHLEQVVKQPDSRFTELERTQGMIIDLAGRLKPDQYGELNENDLSGLIYSVQTYLQLIAELVSSSSIEMRPGDGADEYRELIEQLVTAFKLLIEIVKLLLEIWKAGHGNSPSLTEVQNVLVRAEQQLLTVAKPVSQVKVHQAVPSNEVLNVKTTLESVLALFLHTIERSVNWPLSKLDLVKIPVHIEDLIATILNKLHLQLFISPKLKVNRIVEKITGGLKVLAQNILALVYHGKGRTLTVPDLVAILQQTQEIANSIDADLQKIFSIQVPVRDIGLVNKFSSVLQELKGELNSTLQQLRGTASKKPDLYQLIWKAEKFFMQTAQVLYGPISKPSGLMYEDVFERLRIILNRFSQLVDRVERLNTIIFPLDQYEILPPGNNNVAEIIDLTRQVSKILSDIVVFMGYPVQEVAQQPQLSDLLITLRETTIEIFTKYLQVPLKYEYNGLELAQSVIIIEDFVNNILNGLPHKFLKFLPAVSPESADVLQNILQEIDVLQKVTYLVLKQAERSTLKLNVPGSFQRLEVKHIEYAIASVKRISVLLPKIANDPHLYFEPLSKELSRHEEAILQNAQSFRSILKDPQEVSARTVAKVIFHVQSYMTAVLQGIYGPSKEDDTCRITNIIFHYKHLLEVENDVLDWIDTKKVSNQRAYNSLRNFKITSTELFKCLESTDPESSRASTKVQPDDIRQVVAGLIGEMISAWKGTSPNASIDSQLIIRFHSTVQVLVTNVLDGFQSEIRDDVLAHFYRQIIELLEEVHQLADVTDKTKITMVLDKTTQWLNQLLEFAKQRPQFNLLRNIVEKALQLVQSLQAKSEQISGKLILDRNLMTELKAALQKTVIHIMIPEGINFPTDILRIIEITQLIKDIIITSTNTEAISDIVQQLEILYDILLSLNLSTSPYPVATTTLTPPICDLNKYNKIVEALEEIFTSIASLMRLARNPPVPANQINSAKDRSTQLLNELSSTVLSDLSYCYPIFKTKFSGVEGLLPLVQSISQLLSNLVQKRTPIPREIMVQLEEVMNRILKILEANPSPITPTVSPTTKHVCDSNNYDENVLALREVKLSIRELIQIVKRPSDPSLQTDSFKDRAAQLLNKLQYTILSDLLYCHPEFKNKLPGFEDLLPLVENIAQLLPTLAQKRFPILLEILVELEVMVNDISEILKPITSSSDFSSNTSTMSPTTVQVCSLNNYYEKIETVRDIALSVRELILAIRTPLESSTQIDPAKNRVAQLLNTLSSITLPNLLYCYSKINIQAHGFGDLLLLVKKLKEILSQLVWKESPILLEGLVVLEAIVNDMLEILRPTTSSYSGTSTVSPTTVQLCDLNNYYQKIETVKDIALSVRELILTIRTPSESSTQIDLSKGRVAQLLNTLSSITLPNLLYCYPKINIQAHGFGNLLQLVKKLKEILSQLVWKESPMLIEVLVELEAILNDMLDILRPTASSYSGTPTVSPTTVHVCDLNNYYENIETLKDIALSVKELILAKRTPSETSTQTDIANNRVAQLLNMLSSTALPNLLYCYPKINIQAHGFGDLLLLVKKLKEVLSQLVWKESPMLLDALVVLEAIVNDMLEILSPATPSDMPTVSPTAVQACDSNQYEKIETLKDISLSVRELIKTIGTPSQSSTQIDLAKDRAARLLNILSSTTLPHLLYCYPEIKTQVPGFDNLPNLVKKIEELFSQLAWKELPEILGELEVIVNYIVNILSPPTSPSSSDTSTVSPTTVHVCHFKNQYEKIETLKDIALSVRELIQTIRAPSQSSTQIDRVKDRVARLLNILSSITLPHILYCYPEIKTRVPGFEDLPILVKKIEELFSQLAWKELPEILGELEVIVNYIVNILSPPTSPSSSDTPTVSPTTVRVCDFKNQYEKIKTLKDIALSVRELIQTIGIPSQSSTQIDLAKDRAARLLNILSSTTLPHLLYCYPEIKTQVPGFEDLPNLVKKIEDLFSQLAWKELPGILGELEVIVIYIVNILSPPTSPSSSDTPTVSPTTVHVCDFKNQYEKIETLKDIALSVRELIQTIGAPSQSSTQIDRVKDRVARLLNILSSITLPHILYCYPEIKTRVPGFEDLPILVKKIEELFSQLAWKELPEILGELEVIVNYIVNILSPPTSPSSSDTPTVSPTTVRVCDFKNQYEKIKTLKDIALSVRELIQTIGIPSQSSTQIDLAKDRAARLLNILSSTTLPHLLYCYPEIKTQVPGFEDLPNLVKKIEDLFSQLAWKELPGILGELEVIVIYIVNILSPPTSPSSSDTPTVSPTTVHVCDFKNQYEKIETLKDIALSVRELIQTIGAPSQSSTQIDRVKDRVARLLNILSSITLPHILYCYPEIKTRVPGFEDLPILVKKIEELFSQLAWKELPEILGELEVIVNYIVNILSPPTSPSSSDMPTVSPTTVRVCDFKNQYEKIKTLKDIALSVRELIQTIGIPSQSSTQIDLAKDRAARLLNILSSTTLPHLLYCYPEIKTQVPGFEDLPNLVKKIEELFSQLAWKELPEILGELEVIVIYIVNILSPPTSPSSSDAPAVSPTTISGSTQYFTDKKSSSDTSTGSPTAVSGFAQYFTDEKSSSDTSAGSPTTVSGPAQNFTDEKSSSDKFTGSPPTVSGPAKYFTDEISWSDTSTGSPTTVSGSAQYFTDEKSSSDTSAGSPTTVSGPAQNFTDEKSSSATSTGSPPTVSGSAQYFTDEKSSSDTSTGSPTTVSGSIQYFTDEKSSSDTSAGTPTTVSGPAQNFTDEKSSSDSSTGSPPTVSGSAQYFTDEKSSSDTSTGSPTTVSGPAQNFTDEKSSISGSTLSVVSPPLPMCDPSRLYSIITALKIVLESISNSTNLAENHKIPKTAAEKVVQRVGQEQKNLQEFLIYSRSCGVLSKLLFAELKQLESIMEEIKQLLPQIVNRPSEKAREVLKEIVDVFGMLLVVLKLRTPSPTLVSAFTGPTLVTSTVPSSSFECSQNGTYNVFSSFRAVTMSITGLVNLTQELNVSRRVFQTSVQNIVKQLLDLQNVLQYMRSCNPELGPILSGLEPLLVKIENILRALAESEEEVEAPTLPPGSVAVIVGKVVEISTFVWRIIMTLSVQSNSTVQMHVTTTEFNGTLELIQYLLDLIYQPQITVYPQPSETTYAPPSCKLNSISKLFQHLSGILLLMKDIEQSLATLESNVSLERIRLLHEELSNHHSSLSELLNCSQYLYPQAEWDGIRSALVEITGLLGNITQNLEQTHINPEGVHRLIVTLITHIQLITVLLEDSPVPSPPNLSCDYSLLQEEVSTKIIQINQVAKEIFELLKQQNLRVRSQEIQELGHKLTEYINSLSKVLKCSSPQLPPSLRMQVGKIVLLLQTLTDSLEMLVLDSHSQPSAMEELIGQLLRILEMTQSTTEGTSTTSVASTSSELPSCDLVILQELVKTTIIQLRQLTSQTMALVKNSNPQQRQKEGQKLKNEVRKSIDSLFAISKCNLKQFSPDLQPTLEKVAFTFVKISDSLNIMILNPLVPWEGLQRELNEVDKLLTQLLFIFAQIPGTSTTQIPDRVTTILETQSTTEGTSTTSVASTSSELPSCDLVILQEQVKTTIIQLRQLTSQTVALVKNSNPQQRQKEGQKLKKEVRKSIDSLVAISKCSLKQFSPDLQPTLEKIAFTFVKISDSLNIMILNPLVPWEGLQRELNEVDKLLTQLLFIFTQIPGTSTTQTPDRMTTILEIQSTTEGTSTASVASTSSELPSCDLVILQKQVKTTIIQLRQLISQTLKLVKNSNTQQRQKEGQKLKNEVRKSIDSLVAISKCSLKQFSPGLQAILEKVAFTFEKLIDSLNTMILNPLVPWEGIQIETNEVDELFSQLLIIFSQIPGSPTTQIPEIMTTVLETQSTTEGTSTTSVASTLSELPSCDLVIVQEQVKTTIIQLRQLTSQTVELVKNSNPQQRKKEGQKLKNEVRKTIDSLVAISKCSLKQLSPDLQAILEKVAFTFEKVIDSLNTMILNPLVQWEGIQIEPNEVDELLSQLLIIFTQIPGTSTTQVPDIMTTVLETQSTTEGSSTTSVASTSSELSSCDLVILEEQFKTTIIQLRQMTSQTVELVKNSNPQQRQKEGQKLKNEVRKSIDSLVAISKCSLKQFSPDLQPTLEKVAITFEKLIDSLNTMILNPLVPWDGIKIEPNEVDELFSQLLIIFNQIPGSPTAQIPDRMSTILERQSTTEGTSTTSVASTSSELSSCDLVILQEQVKTTIIRLRQLTSQTVELVKNSNPQQRQKGGQKLKNEVRKSIDSLFAISKCSLKQLSPDLQAILEKVAFTFEKLIDSLNTMTLNPLVPWKGIQIEPNEVDELFSQLLIIFNQIPGSPTTQVPDRMTPVLETKDVLQSVIQAFEVLWRLVRDPNTSQSSIIQAIQQLGTNLRNLIVVIEILDRSDTNLIPFEIREIYIEILYDFRQMTPVLETVIRQLDEMEAVHMIPEELNDILKFIFKYAQQLQQLILITLGENPDPYINVEKPVKLVRELLVVVVHVAESLRNPNTFNMTEGITQLLVTIQRLILETANLSSYPSTHEFILQLRSLADKLREVLDAIGDAAVSGEASAELILILNMITEYGSKILQLQPPEFGDNEKLPEEILHLLQRLNDKLQEVAQGGIPNTNHLTELHLIVQQTIALISVLYDSPEGTSGYGLVEQLKSLPPLFEVFLMLSKRCTSEGSCSIPDLMKVIITLMKKIEEITVGSPNTGPSVVSSTTSLGPEIVSTTAPLIPNVHANKVTEKVKLYIRQMIALVSKILNDPADIVAKRDLFALVQELLNYINSLPSVYVEEYSDAVSSNILIQMLKGSITIFEELFNVLDCVLSRCTHSSYDELVELLDVILRIAKSLLLLPDVATVAPPADPQLNQHLLDIYEITKALIAKLSVSDVAYGDLAHLIEQLGQTIEKYIKLSTSGGETAMYFRRFNALLQFSSEYLQWLQYDFNVDNFTSILRVIMEFILKVPGLFPNIAKPSLSFNLIDLVTSLGSQLKKVVEVEVDSILFTFSNQSDLNNSVFISTLNKLVDYINEYFTIINQAPDDVTNDQPPKLVELFIEAKDLVTILEEVVNVARILIEEGPLQANLEKFKQLLKEFILTGNSVIQCTDEHCWSRNTSEDETWHDDDHQLIPAIHENVRALLGALEGLARKLNSKHSLELNLTKLTKAVNTYILTQQDLPNHLSIGGLGAVIPHYRELGLYLETALGLLVKKKHEHQTLQEQFINLVISHAQRVMSSTAMFD